MLYVKHQTNNVLTISLYVDDLLVIGNNVEMVKEFKQERNDEGFLDDKSWVNDFLSWNGN